LVQMTIADQSHGIDLALTFQSHHVIPRLQSRGHKHSVRRQQKIGPSFSEPWGVLLAKMRIIKSCVGHLEPEKKQRAKQNLGKKRFGDSAKG